MEVTDSVSGAISPHQWRQFMQLGMGVSDKRLQDRLDMLLPNKCCSLIYTVSHCLYVNRSLYITYYHYHRCEVHVLYL